MAMVVLVTLLLINNKLAKCFRGSESFVKKGIHIHHGLASGQWIAGWQARVP